VRALHNEILFMLAVLAVTATFELRLPVFAAQPSLEQLKTDLKSPETKTRKKAASALGKSMDREAVPPLLAAAQDSDAEVREEVVKALGVLRDEQAITMLLTTIRDPAESVREESLFALLNLYGEPGKEFVVTRLAKGAYRKMNPFSDQVGTDPTVIEPYVKVAPAVIDGIAERLIDSSLSIRLDAAKALGILKAHSALPKMLEAMKTGDSNLRIAILRSLYKIKDPSVDEQILPYLNDSEKDVRDETILTLGLLRSRKALPAIQKIYDQKPGAKVGGKALQAISLIGDAGSFELFRKNLKDPDSLRRQYAAEGIARVGNESVVEEVSSAFLKEGKLNTQMALSFALYRLGRREYMEKLISGLAERMHHEQVISYFIEMGNPVQSDLLTYLTHDNARVRERLCYVLGIIGDQTTVEKLRPLLKDSDSAVVSEAALAIRRLGAAS